MYNSQDVYLKNSISALNPQNQMEYFCVFYRTISFTVTFQRTLNRSRYQSTTRAKGQKTPKLVSGDRVELKFFSDAFLHYTSETISLVMIVGYKKRLSLKRWWFSYKILKYWICVINVITCSPSHWKCHAFIVICHASVCRSQSVHVLFLW